MTLSSSTPSDVFPLPKRASRIHFICLIGILLVAAGLRIYQLGTPSFWFDEVASVVLACGHWQAFFTHLNGYFAHAPDLASPSAIKPLWTLLVEPDSHPPLYILLLRGWWTIFGMSDVSLRAMSVLASLLAILVLFDVARLIAGPTPAVWACAIMAVAPDQVRYAQEARGYTLLLFLSLAACNPLLRLYRLGPGRWRMAALGIFATATLLTHYLVGGAVAGLLVFAAVRLKGQQRTLAVAVVMFSFIVLFAARLPVMLARGAPLMGAVHFLDDPREGLVGRTIFRAAALPAWYLVQPRDSAMAMGLPAVVLIALPFLLNSRRPGLLLTGLWSGGVIAMVAVSDVVFGHNALLHIRYTLAAAPMVFVAAVTLADMGGRWLRHTVPALVIAGCVLGLPFMYATEIASKTEARAWGGDIRTHVAADDVLVVASAPDMGLYSAGLEYPQIAFYAYPLPCAVAVLEGPADRNVRALIWAHKRVWVANCYYGVAIENILGPCRIVELEKVRYQVGRLMRVEQLPPASGPTTTRSE